VIAPNRSDGVALTRLPSLAGPTAGLRSHGLGRGPGQRPITDSPSDIRSLVEHHLNPGQQRQAALLWLDDQRVRPRPLSRPAPCTGGERSRHLQAGQTDAIVGSPWSGAKRIFHRAHTIQLLVEWGQIEILGEKILGQRGRRDFSHASS